MTVYPFPFDARMEAVAAELWESARADLERAGIVAAPWTDLPEYPDGAELRQHYRALAAAKLQASR